MLNMLLMAVAIIWGSSALAVFVIFAVDERAFRRRSAESQSSSQDPIPTPEVQPVSAPSRQLVSSSAG